MDLAQAAAAAATLHEAKISSQVFQENDKIDALRNELFGITATGKCEAPAHMVDALHQSVMRLSVDLYSKRCHFIYEIIQNFEDNRYAMGIVPEAIFELSEQRLIARNNELGFQETDLRALCSIGKSTKEAKHGYIGQKGIGFKSVFTITDQPHVYSNGLAFKFSKVPLTPEVPLGYIVPYRLRDTRQAMEVLGGDPASLQSGKLPYLRFTNLVFPLAEDPACPGELPAYMEVQAEIEALPAYTILFLRKLQRIRFNLPQGKRVQFTKRVLRGTRHFSSILPPRHTAELVSQGGGGLNWGDGGSKSWLIVSHEAPRPHDIVEEGREGIEASTVTVALPLAESEWPRLMDKGVVFAYLPTETIPGFPFLLNANFVLAASRERLHDRRWNEWLLSLVPGTFCVAFMLLLENTLHPRKDVTSMSAGEADGTSSAGSTPPRWESLYRLVRPPNEYNGSPLKATGVAIHATLSTTRCVVCHDEILQSPDQCRFASNELISVMGGDASNGNRQPSCLDGRIYLIHPNLRDDNKSSTLLRSLGSKSFDKALLLECVGDVKWLRSHAASPRWYMGLFELCHSHSVRPSQLHKGIPLEGTTRFIQDKDTATLFLDTGEEIPAGVLVPALVLFFDKRLRALVAKSSELEAWLSP